MLNKILFYYSIVLCSIVFVGAIFFYPKFVNIVLAVGFLPVVGYFWIVSSEPEKVSFPIWSFRFLIIVLVLSALGVLAYASWMKPANQTRDKGQEAASSLDEVKRAIEKLASSEETTKNEALLEALEGIHAELTQIKAEQRGINTILGITSSASDAASIISNLENLGSSGISQDEMGFVEVSGTSEASVYQNADLGSNLVGTLKPGSRYPFFKKEDGWYQVLLPNDTEGWVSQTKVKETN